MPHSRIAAAILVFGAALLSVSGSAQQGPPDGVHIAIGQNATIGLIAGGPGSTDARIASDIAQVLDDGDRLRVLPILGQSSVQNIADLIYLKGIDVAIVHADVLTETMQRGSIPREASVQYIAKLFPEEIHVLARKDVLALNDLNGKIVSIGTAGSGTELTASAVLDLAHVKPNILNDRPSVALERLRRGEIAAMFVIGGKPVPMLQAIEPGTGLHFLPIPLNAALVDSYLPTNLDHQQYPTLVPAGQPVDTLAVGAVLITLSTPPDTARAKRVNRFVDTLFERFDQFRQPGFHPKWQEVNLSAQLQGWTRYPEVLNLLKKDQADDANLRTSFDAYVNRSGQSPATMSNERREALFRDFLRWRDQHSGP
ncbi:MAG TPA: TAXI family TRAP transporter solute-binding subunit [Rhodopila sp.]